MDGPKVAILSNQIAIGVILIELLAQRARDEGVRDPMNGERSEIYLAQLAHALSAYIDRLPIKGVTTEEDRATRDEAKAIAQQLTNTAAMVLRAESLSKVDPTPLQ